MLLISYVKDFLCVLWETWSWHATLVQIQSYSYLTKTTFSWNLNWQPKLVEKYFNRTAWWSGFLIMSGHLVFLFFLLTKTNTIEWGLSSRAEGWNKIIHWQRNNRKTYEMVMHLQVLTFQHQDTASIWFSFFIGISDLSFM